MPIYEFRCVDCSLEFEELFRSASEKRRVVCPACGSPDVAKQWSVFGFSVSGGGSSSSCGDACSNCSGGSCETCGH